jgi:LysM repeat protein
VKITFFLLIPLLMGVSSFQALHAAPKAYYAPPPNPIDGLKNQLSNHDAELNSLQQRVENFHVILESLQEQLQDQGNSQKQQFKKDSASLEIKIASLENMAKSLTADIKLLQSHANETGAALQAMKQKISEGEQRIHVQNGNIENLQSVIQTLMEALQVKAEVASGGKSYKVKPGDSLEKIARGHGTTVQALKNLNGMASDKIVVGKMLQIPE